MGIMRGAVGALLALVVTAFVAYCILMPINDVLLSSQFQKLTSIFPFPFLSEALGSGGEEEKAMSFLAKDRQYAAAVYILWGLTFLAALLTLLMRNTPSSHGKGKHSAAAAEPLLDAPKPFSRPYSVTRRILHYHLPPRGFWAWWCGGMAVYDALVVAAWIAINILYTQQRVALILPLFKDFIAKGVFDWSIAQAIIVLTSGALGWAATLDILLMMYPVPRSTFLHWMMGESFPTLIKYHRWVGHGTMVLLTLHGFGFYGVWLYTAEYTRGLVWDRTGTNMLAGTISWLGGCALWATSVEYVRRRFFELFYKTHILGLITFFMFGFMHHVSLWAYTMPGILLYLLDMAFRVAQQAQPVVVSNVSVCKSATLATLHFNADPNTPIKPIQDLFLGVDGLSPVQWHPYSTVGGDQGHTLVAHIKAYGKWTTGLLNRVLNRGSVVMRVDGPYGEFAEHPEWTHYKTLVIIAGGIGVTPVFGILNDLKQRHEGSDGNGGSGGPVPQKVVLVYVASMKNELALLQRPMIAQAIQDGWLELDAYYTGANRGTDPSDIVAPGAKPDSISPSDSAVDLTRPQANPSALKTTPADDGHGHIVRQVLPAYWFGDWHWASAHVLCLVGAVLGSIGSFAWQAHANSVSEGGAPTWLLGLYLILFPSLGGMLLPALIIVPAHIIRARRVRKSSLTSELNGNGLVDSSEDAQAQAEQGGLVGLQGMKASPGRPNISAVLSRVVQEFSTEQEIGVVAAGPEPMVDAVVECCHNHNDTVGLLGRPYLDVGKHTFSL
ncbi:g490 [Coccomyxa viridis]|uniref:G490 protein n=1 Tax=Coccomyxa viridis TaxID=1274662 RepID=A0ABP1FHG0_9CHLO